MPNTCYVQVNHPKFACDQALNIWVDKLDLRTDDSLEIIFFTNAIYSFDGINPNFVIDFKSHNYVELNIVGHFSRVIYFYNVNNYEECMQCLLDLFINSWAKQSMVGISYADIIAVLSESKLGVIESVDNVKFLSGHCEKATVKNDFIKDYKLTSLLCIYREYDPKLEDFGNYGIAIDGLANKDTLVVVGLLPVKKSIDKQSSVIYYGFS